MGIEKIKTFAKVSFREEREFVFEFLFDNDKVSLLPGVSNFILDMEKIGVHITPYEAIWIVLGEIVFAKILYKDEGMIRCQVTGWKALDVLSEVKEHVGASEIL